MILSKRQINISYALGPAAGVIIHCALVPCCAAMGNESVMVYRGVMKHGSFRSLGPRRLCDVNLTHFLKWEPRVIFKHKSDFVY